MPTSRPVRFGSAIVAIAVLIAFVPACITISSTGRSSGDMKRELQESFLFRAADWFYPQGPAADPAALPTLSSKQVNEIQRNVRLLFASLIEFGKRATPVVDSLLAPSVAVVSRASLELSNNGVATARVQADGDITIDVRLLQAFFRTALLTGWRDPDTPWFRRSDLSETEIFAQFWKHKKAVDELRGRSRLGDLIQAIGDEELDGSWFQAAELVSLSRDVQQRFVATTSFASAHELGHLALEHHARVSGLQDCSVLLEVELDADRYATAILALAAGPLVAFDLGYKGNFFDARSYVGFDDFFSVTHDVAGFGSSDAHGCAYPSASDRLAASEAVYVQAQRLLRVF